MEVVTQFGKQPVEMENPVRKVEKPKNEGKPNPDEVVVGSVEREEEKVKDAQETETRVKKKASKKTARRAGSDG